MSLYERIIVVITPTKAVTPTVSSPMAHAATAHSWPTRPLPDLAIVITDDVEAVVGRAEARDSVAYTAEQWFDGFAPTSVIP